MSGGRRSARRRQHGPRGGPAAGDAGAAPPESGGCELWNEGVPASFACRTGEQCVNRQGGRMVASRPSAGEVPAVTVGGHFERVAAVYESLRTTDEAPVRAIGPAPARPPRHRLGYRLRHGPVLAAAARAVLPEGSRLAASDVSAAMLAQLKAGNHGRAGGGAAAGSGRRTALADRQPRPGHRVQLRAPLRPRPVPDRRRRVLAAGGQLFIYTRTPQQNARTIWGRYFPASPSTSSACTARPRSGRPSGQPAGSKQPEHRPSSSRAPAQPNGSRPRPKDGTTRPSPCTHRRSCARPSRPSWPACPAPRSAGLTSTSWSWPVASRRNQGQPDGRARPARPAIKDQAIGSALPAGKAPSRPPDGRADHPVRHRQF